MLGGIGGRRRRGRQRMRWLDGITNSMDMIWVNSGSWWWTGRPGLLQFMGSQCRTRLRDWTDWTDWLTNYIMDLKIIFYNLFLVYMPVIVDQTFYLFFLIVLNCSFFFFSFFLAFGFFQDLFFGFLKFEFKKSGFSFHLFYVIYPIWCFWNFLNFWFGVCIRFRKLSCK